MVDIPARVIGHWAVQAFGERIPAHLTRWWAGATEAQKEAKAAIRRVTGPFGATLHHLAQIGWTMVSPSCLEDSRGVQYDLTSTAPSG